MAHFKRKKPKQSRAGCICCKPHKANGLKDQFSAQTEQEKRAIISESEQKKEMNDVY